MVVTRRFAAALQNPAYRPTGNSSFRLNVSDVVSRPATTFLRSDVALGLPCNALRRTGCERAGHGRPSHHRPGSPLCQTASRSGVVAFPASLQNIRWDKDGVMASKSYGFLMPGPQKATEN